MSWLIHPRVAAELETGRDQRPTAEQQEAFEARALQRVADTPFTQAEDGVAEIQVEGVLTKRPSLLAALFGGGNTSYQAIQEALRAARRDEHVRSIRLSIDSPGGSVDGLFETLAAIEATRANKPIEVLASNANSAAYAIAAVAGPIRATTPGSTFGSIGTAVSVLTSDRIVTLTNSASPKKRPDPKTEEGKAAIVEELDAITELFVSHIAKGRRVAIDTVYQTFGRGGVLLAGEALRRGMIDSIAGAPADQNDAANLEWLRTEHPQLFADLVSQGVQQERERASILLEGARLSGDGPSQGLELAKAAVRNGAPVTDSMREALFLAALQQEREMDRRLAVQRARTSPNFADIARKYLGTDEAEAAAFSELVVSKFEQLMGLTHEVSGASGETGELEVHQDGRLRVWL